MDEKYKRVYKKYKAKYRQLAGAEHVESTAQPVILFTDAGEDCDDSIAIMLLIARHLSGEIRFAGIVLCGAGRMLLRIKVICRVFYELGIEPHKMPPIFTGSHTKNTQDVDGKAHVFRQRDFAEGCSVKESWHTYEFDTRNINWSRDKQEYIEKIKINGDTGHTVCHSLREVSQSGKLSEPDCRLDDQLRYQAWAVISNASDSPVFNQEDPVNSGVAAFSEWFKSENMNAEDKNVQIVSIGPMDTLLACVEHADSEERYDPFGNCDLIAMIGSVYKWYGAPGSRHRNDPIAEGKGYHPPEFNANQAGAAFASVMRVNWNRKVLVPLDTCGFLEYMSDESDPTANLYHHFMRSEQDNPAIRLFLELYEQWARIFQLQPAKRGAWQRRRVGHTDRDMLGLDDPARLVELARSKPKIGVLFDVLAVVLAGNLDKQEYIFDLIGDTTLYIYAGGSNGDWFTSDEKTGRGICGKILTAAQVKAYKKKPHTQNKKEIVDLEAVVTATWEVRGAQPWAKDEPSKKLEEVVEACSWKKIDNVCLALYWNDHRSGNNDNLKLATESRITGDQDTLKTQMDLDKTQRTSSGFVKFMTDVHEYLIRIGGQSVSDGSDALDTSNFSL